MMSCRLQRLHNKSEAKELEPCAWRCKTVRAQAPCARNGHLPSLCSLLHPGPAQAQQTVLSCVQRGSPPTMLCCFPYYLISFLLTALNDFLLSKQMLRLLYNAVKFESNVIFNSPWLFNSLHWEIITVFYLLEFYSLILRSYNRVVSKLRSNALLHN